MAETINWTTNVQVVGGPMFTIGGAEDVTAYEVIDVNIAGGGSTDVTIGASGTNLTFLLAQADMYNVLLTYTVNPVAGATVHKFDAPVMLVGPGATGLLAAVVTSIKFANGMTDAINIKLLIGRKAQ